MPVSAPPARLHASEEQFRLLVENVGDAVFMLDIDGRVETWTPAAARIFGYTAEEIVGTPVVAFYAQAARVCAEDLDELRVARDEGRFEIDDWRIRRDGSPFWAHVVTCPIRGDGGALLGYAKIVRDLSSVRQAEEAQARYAQALERSNRELEAFAAIASHDLQEPLRKILAFGDRLKKHSGAALGEKGSEYLERVQHASQRMQRLVDELLAYSRLAAAPEKMQMVDLGKVLGEVLADLESRIESSRATVDVGPLPHLEGNPMQLRQLFQNLIANALKFQPPDARPVVTLRARKVPGVPGRAMVRAAERWEIDVADNGIGFEEKYVDRIFGMLQRLHGRDEFEGTGMGLAICRKIAEQHEGSIRARSALGQGATFTVTLPTVQPPKGVAVVGP